MVEVCSCRLALMDKELASLATSIRSSDFDMTYVTGFGTINN